MLANDTRGRLRSIFKAFSVVDICDMVADLIVIHDFIEENVRPNFW